MPESVFVTGVSRGARHHAGRCGRRLQRQRVKRLQHLRLEKRPRERDRCDDLVSVFL
ncbi:hypothetical protein [Nitrosomonas communis]|uniref:hypothetical protein n=1 Tax=Nitrosomonas communis TaxID=44574 RepID=UPI003D2A7E9A